MRVRLLTLRYSPTLGGFDDTPLQEFTRCRELLEFREHFYAVHEVPHLTCVLTSWPKAPRRPWSWPSGRDRRAHHLGPPRPDHCFLPGRPSIRQAAARSYRYSGAKSAPVGHTSVFSSWFNWN